MWLDIKDEEGGSRSQGYPDIPRWGRAVHLHGMRPLVNGVEERGMTWMVDAARQVGAALLQVPAMC